MTDISLVLLVGQIGLLYEITWAWCSQVSVFLADIQSKWQFEVTAQLIQVIIIITTTTPPQI